MNWFRSFMQGRHGLDTLAVVLIILSIILAYTGQALRLDILVVFSLIPLLLGIFRVFSPESSKRRYENDKLLNFTSRLGVQNLSNKIRILMNRLKDSKTHCYFKCPACRQTLRVPRGRGRICIICPKCKMEIIKKT